MNHMSVVKDISMPRTYIPYLVINQPCRLPANKMSILSSMLLNPRGL